MRKLLVPTAFIALSACSNLVPSTLLRLNALDPFTADPNDMAVALELPAGLGLQPASTRMVFEAVHSPSGETFVREYVLQEDRSSEGQVIYTLSQQDVADLAALKVQLEPWRQTSDGNSSLSMGVTSDACRIPEIEIGPDPRINVFLRLEAEGPLRPFLRDAPIREYYEIESLAQLPQCSGPF